MLIFSTSSKRRPTLLGSLLMEVAKLTKMNPYCESLNLKFFRDQFLRIRLFKKGFMGFIFVKAD